jgi:putative nucleotidyltransferase with HDIG domain
LRARCEMQVLRDPISIRIDKNFELPSIPLVLTKILQALDNDSASSSQLQELILHDPPLSARILKLANSAFYSFKTEVKTISHAISLLGINLVKSLAIGVNLFDSFTKGMRSEAFILNKLWTHSFGVGLVAQEIWTPRSSRKDGEFAFLCGLLHDIGKVVFFKKDASLYRPIFAANKSQKDPDISHYETEIYGVDHAEMGAILAKEWGLPPELVTAIRYHHSASESGALRVAAISMADMIAKVTELGYDGDRKVDPSVDRIQARLIMSAEERTRLMNFAGSKRKPIEEFFEVSS